MDNLPFWLSCAVAIASIHLSVLASQFFHRKRRSSDAASTTSTDAELQEPIPTVSASPGSNYQVFLSFHGPDTRTDFTDHLYHRLVDAGICVFRDDNNLHEGRKIDLELRDSIDKSRIFIPILSQGYASSEWCLHELTQAIECNKNAGQIVLPIFYKVEPSHVRRQKGNFGKGFDSLRKRSKPNVVEKWEQALGDVASIKGLESEKIAHGHKGALVKLVVEAVLGYLKQDFQLDVCDHLVGIDLHVKDIINLVETSSNNTRMIGIYGMGGIGKTTLAKCIYNKLSKKFAYRSFIADVRETVRRHGIRHSQSQLLSDILGCETNVSRVDDGVNIIKFRCKSSKVLIIIDDVDNEDQLDNLARERAWFGHGSVIIVTTRDKGVLDRVEFGVDYKYELKELDLQESLLLFCRHAFRSDTPLGEFQLLSRDVVATSGGLPLALEVIGSLLFGIRDLETWEDTIKKLKCAPEQKVQEKLKISYDALDQKTKEIFLDVACFFIGNETTYPTYMWDACDFAPRIRIQILERRCLLKIEQKVFWMHDQLRDFGREIVRQEDYYEPKNRSRLGDMEEVLNVLERNEGSEKIRAIRAMSGGYRKEVFEKFPNLRMLHCGSVSIEGDSRNSFSVSELRWLQWYASMLHPQQLTDLHLEKLVILQLSYIEISDDWGGWSSMKISSSLKVLEFTNCMGIRNSPDLSHYTNLEILKINNCDGLERIHPSIGEMKSLVCLNLSQCFSLKELPIEVRELQKLKHLFIDVTKIVEIPEWIVYLKNLETLSARDCRSLAWIPQSIGDLVKLSNLQFWNCKRLVQVPCSIGKLESLTKLDVSFTSITKLPEAIWHAKNLQELIAVDCRHLVVEIPSEIGNLRSLKILQFSRTRINGLPRTISNLTSFQVLEFGYCNQLDPLLRLPSSLLKIVIEGCRKLEKLPNLSNLKLLTELKVCSCSKLTEITGLKGLKSLSRLNVLRCPKLLRLDGLQHLESLKYLFMGLVANEDKFETQCQVDDDDDAADDGHELDTQFLDRLKFLEELSVSGHNSIEMLDLTQFISLRKLWARNCRNLIEIQGLGMAENLTMLDISGCKSIERLPDLSCCKALEKLNINFCENLCDIEGPEKFPSCSILYVRGCHSLENLPDLSNCDYLRELALENCSKLVKISGFEKSSYLEYINISGCNSITTLPNLSACKNLKYLVARDCLSLTKLEGLEDLGISFMDISGCRSMGPLPDLSGTQLALNYEVEAPPFLSVPVDKCIRFCIGKAMNWYW